jgi:hypothetical protein
MMKGSSVSSRSMLVEGCGVGYALNSLRIAIDKNHR